MRPCSITTIQFKTRPAVYVALYNATALWHTIGLIWVVMGCYGRKSEFADVAEKTGLDRLKPVKTEDRSRTAKDRKRPVLIGPVRFFDLLW